MNTTLEAIPIANLALAFLPMAVVVLLLFRWRLEARTAVYAAARMLVQLLAIGYVLIFIFETNRPAVILAVVAVMIVASSWIALRPVRDKDRGLYARALGAIALGGGLTLVVVTQAVLALEPWFMPRFFVPLAGMIFSSAMNAVSLAAERFEAETARGVPYAEARRTAYWASLIPVVNALFAVGLVSLPGMMTGQILSGVSPLVAVTYQIMVMSMLLGAAGISSGIYLVFLRARAAGPEADATGRESG